jgi:hypothetical protein
MMIGMNLFLLFAIVSLLRYSLFRDSLIPSFPEVNHLDARALQQIDAIRQTILLAINHAFDSRLDDEFCTLDAG